MMAVQRGERTEDFATTQAILRMLLEPYLPTPEMERRFEPLLPMLARTICLGNFSDMNYVYRLKLFFYSVRLWLKLGLPDVAVQRMAEMIFEVQGTRSVGGFERRMEVTTRTITESVSPSPQPKKRGILSRLFGIGKEVERRPEEEVR